MGQYSYSNGGICQDKPPAVDPLPSLLYSQFPRSPPITVDCMELPEAFPLQGGRKGEKLFSRPVKSSEVSVCD